MHLKCENTYVSGRYNTWDVCMFIFVLEVQRIVCYLCYFKQPVRFWSLWSCILWLCWILLQHFYSSAAAVSLMLCYYFIADVSSFHCYCFTFTTNMLFSLLQFTVYVVTDLLLIVLTALVCSSLTVEIIMQDVGIALSNFWHFCLNILCHVVYYETDVTTKATSFSTLSIYRV